MSSWADAGVAVIAAGGLALAVAAWRSRSVLTFVAAGSSVALVAFAATRGLTGAAARAASVLALVVLLAGVAIFGLGEFLERLLEAPEDREGRRGDEPTRPVDGPGSAC